MRMTRRNIGRRLALVAAILLITACDAGKGPYNEAVTLEEQGKAVEAADKYDGVCRRAPDSKLCAPSIERASNLRLKLADAAVKAFTFTEAEQLLKAVQESGDARSKEKSKDLLASKDVVEGLRWQAALAAPDKHAALKDMETVAASGTLATAKANEWLAKERAPLLLADATAACTPNPTPPCPAVCDRLLRLHGGTPEAAKAGEYLNAFRAAEAVRTYPLLVQAEEFLQARAREKKDDERHQACYLRGLAYDPSNPLAALLACGEVNTSAVEKTKASWDELIEAIKDQGIVDRLQARWTTAENDGEYLRQSVPRPAPVGAVGAATSAKTREVSVMDPAGSPTASVNALVGESVAVTLPGYMGFNRWTYVSVDGALGRARMEVVPRWMGPGTPGIKFTLATSGVAVGDHVVQFKSIPVPGNSSAPLDEAVTIHLATAEAQAGPDPTATPPGRFHAAHVLVQWAGSTDSRQRRSKADALARAQEAKAKLDGGEAFESVASVYDDDAARTRGGDLGTFAPGTFPKPFETAVAALSVGSVSDIVETSFGFHVIKRLP